MRIIMRIVICVYIYIYYRRVSRQICTHISTCSDVADVGSVGGVPRKYIIYE